jgi:flagellar biosynthesis protein FlhA
LPARWVKEELRDEAEIRGYTVIDPTSVLVTHLAETLRNSIGEILTRDDVKELVEAVKKNSPAVVEELTSDKTSFGDIQAVLRNLLQDGVPIRNMPAILEVLADNPTKLKDPEAMGELVRQRLGRVLCELHSDAAGTLHAITLDPDIESRLATAVGGGEPGAPSVNPAYLQSLMERIGESVGLAAQGGKDVVLLVRSNVRRFLNELVRASLPKLSVLSYNEVVPARAVETQVMVRMEE